MARREWALLCAIVVIALSLRMALCIPGLGQGDQGKLLLTAALNHETGEWAWSSYSVRTSPLLLLIARAALRAGVAVEDLTPAWNQLNAVLSALALAPLHLLLRRHVAPVVALTTAFVFSFVPTYWIYGLHAMPTVPALLFLLLSLLAFDVGLTSAGRRAGVMFAVAVAALGVACGFKADVILVGLAYLGLALARGPLTRRTVVAALAVPVVGIAVPAVLTRLCGMVTSGPAEFVATFYDKYSWHPAYLFSRYQFKVNALSLGPGLWLLVAAAVVVCVRRKEHRPLLLLTALWALPPLLFWGMFEGNTARHVAFALPVLTALALVGGHEIGRRRAWMPLAAGVAALLLNAALTAPSGGAKIPSGRLWAAARLHRADSEALHARAREALASGARNLRITKRGGTYPWLLLELLSQSTKYHRDDARILRATLRDGTQAVAVTSAPDPPWVPGDVYHWPSGERSIR